MKSFKYLTKLQRLNEQLRTAQQLIHIGNWELRIADNLLTWSEGTCRMFGISDENFPASVEAFMSFVHPEDRLRLLAAHERAAQGESLLDVEHRIVRPDGEVRYVHELAQLLADQDGRPLLSGTMHDITERKRSQERLQQSTTLVQLAAGIAHMGGWEMEWPEKRVGWSDEVCAIHDLTPGASPSAQDALNFCAPEWREKVKEVFDACGRDGTPFDEEWQIITAKGRRTWVRAIGQAVRDGSGAITRLQGAFQDITEKRQSENDALQLAARLTTTLESITDAFYTLDREWRFTYLNKESERLLQRPRAELLGKVIWKEFKELAGTIAEREFHRAFHENCTAVFEQFFAPLQSWSEVRAYPSEAGLVVYFRDITELKQAQEAIRESEARFKIVAKATTDGIWDWDANAERLWWNEGMQTLFGLPVQETEPGMESWSKRIHPDDKARVLHGVQTVINGGGENWTDEYRFMREDGSYAYVLDRGFVIRDGDGRVLRVMGGMTDQSARKLSEIERDRLHKEKMLLLESTGEGIWGIDIDGLCTFINGAAARMLGYEVSEVLGKHMHALTHHRHADGSPYPVDQCPIFQAFRTGRSWRKDDEVFWRKDGTSFPVEYSSYPILDAGKAIGSVVTFSDITERKQAELEIIRINRALRMRSACNELLIRAANETELLTNVCRLACDIGGYRMAWVGYAQDDETRAIRIAAHAANQEDAAYIGGLRLNWADDNPIGLGPAGRSVRSGMAEVGEVLTRGSTFVPWLAPVQQRGLRGVICLPLRDRERTFGLLTLYSNELLPTTAEEMKLLQELADDLAFGIGNLRAQEERRRIHAAVLKVAAGVSARTGTKFFEQLARNMAEAVGAHAGVVARLLPGQPITARTIAAIVAGEIADNFEYVIEGAPCEHVLHDDHRVVPASVAERFPDSPLSALGAQAYVGERLVNAGGQTVGLVFVLFREPLKRSDFVTSTLRIFATRASAELDRQAADARISDQASLLDKAKDAIVVSGIDNLVHFWNKGAERLYGWTQEEAIGRSIEDLVYDDPAAFREATRSVLEYGEWRGEITERRKDGSIVTIEANWTLARNDDGQPQSILAIKTDITQRKAAENEIQNLAFYDPLTNLPNRRLLVDRLRHALSSSARSRCSGALLFIDLDNFKTLNDTFGHDQGDLLLQQVAVRLSACVRDSDTVARLGGDEFVVLLENLSESRHEAAIDAKNLGEKILAALNDPFLLAGYKHYSTPSIGVTLFNDQQDNVGDLLKRADLAMYQAKAAGRNTLRFFDSEMQAVVAARTALEAELRQGLQQHEFLLHYQPQMDNTGRVIGAEALVRWQQPSRGMVCPADFIPLAEETGLILSLGQWVLETACTQLVAWAASPETAQLSLAVNVSARQFRHPDFVEQVLTLLGNTGANPQNLKLELTESLLVEDMEATIAKMSALKDKGVGFSLDDFGTGYSSLAYLKRLPLDELKIDQSFVRDVLTDPNDEAIARTIIALGRSLGLKVIAEGVETEAQRDFLARHDCHAFQGYLFSRPLPAREFAAFIRAKRKP
jgi:diguanylate cyclase (GGDEF)-like protein/PAS domain S-box-containing protein